MWGKQAGRQETIWGSIMTKFLRTSMGVSSRAVGGSEQSWRLISAVESVFRKACGKCSSWPQYLDEGMIFSLRAGLYTSAFPCAILVWSFQHPVWWEAEVPSLLFSGHGLRHGRGGLPKAA